MTFWGISKACMAFHIFSSDIKTLRALVSTLTTSSSEYSRHKSSATFSVESPMASTSEDADEASTVPAALLVAPAVSLGGICGGAGITFVRTVFGGGPDCGFGPGAEAVLDDAVGFVLR